MNKRRINKVFSRFISRDREEIVPKTFFQVLSEIEQESVHRTIELHAKFVKGKLRFEPSPEISVHNNEIILNNHRIVVNVS